MACEAERRDGPGAPTGPMVTAQPAALGCKNSCLFTQEPATAAGSTGVGQETGCSQSTAPDGRGELLSG